ncbi:hypothetical protein E7Y31_12260 [Candidatus Frankia alpina]|uniref:Uncharacterized protein n=1 Tax=Candidatus Frankia alpina TaxID=2699483 RepID=A0A4S5EPK2_9ACTN|nr:hypothetical protein E7Y31_12260 [Candidatus Frankia alpina]
MHAPRAHRVRGRMCGGFRWRHPSGGRAEPRPAHFEQASALVTEEMAAAFAGCGPDNGGWRPGAGWQ